MITRLRQLITGRYPYPNSLDRRRAQVLLSVSAFSTLLLLIWLLARILPQLERGIVVTLDLVAVIVALVASLVIFPLVQAGHLKVASWLFVAVLVLDAMLLTILSNFTGGVAILDTGMIALTIPLVAAGVLLDRRATLIVLLVLLAAVIYGALGQSQVNTPVTLQPASRVLLDLSMLVMSLTTIFVFLVVVAGSFQTLIVSLAETAQQRSWLNGFGMELTQSTDEKTLEASTLQQLRQNLPQLLTEWYVLNEEGNLLRSARLAESGDHVFRLTDNNILAEAARSGQIVTANLSDHTLRRSHLAASREFLAAVPIRVGEDMTGVLDFQSATAFSSDQLSTFRLVAEQIGLALRQVRQTHGLQTNLREQEATITNLQSQIQANDLRRQQGVSDMWSDYIEGRGTSIIGYSLDESNATPVPISELPSTLAASLKSGEVQIEQRGDEQLIHVPIIFRDYNLGAMSFAVPAGQSLSERQVEVARTVAERLALALENTRLFEQSQSQAQRERKANEIASILIGATDVRLVLNLAAENFKEALGAVNTHIYIQPDLPVEARTRATRETAR